MLLMSSLNCTFSKSFLQKKRFKKILKFAYKNSIFYREYYNSHGIYKRDLEDVKITDLPFIDKSMVMENFDQIVTDKKLKKHEIENYLCNLTKERIGKKYLDDFTLLHTSGSSGILGFFVYGKDDWDTLKAMTISRVSKGWLSFKEKKRIAFLGATEGNYAGCSLTRSAPSFMYDKLLIPISQPRNEILQSISNYQPNIISGYSHGAHLLAEAQLKNEISIKPQKIFSSGEPLCQKTCELVYKAWGVYPMNFYAATESICFGIKKDMESEFDLFNDFHIFEILDENDHEVSPGEEGGLVLSNLYNYTQPLIRYRMGDMLQKSKAIQNEYEYQKISRITGRSGKTLKFKNPFGENIQIVSHMLNEFISPGVQRFQFVQPHANEILIKIKLEKQDDMFIREAYQRLGNILEKHGLLESVNRKVVVVDDFSVNPVTNKFELITPLLQT